MAHAVLSRTVFPVLRSFFQEIRGIENIPQHGPVIIAANHVGLIDYFFIAAAILPHRNTRLHFISKRLWFRDVFLKRWWGQIAIDPQNPRAVLDEAAACLQKGEMVVIFPEGFASGNAPTLLPAKHGVATLAQRTGVPVIPLGFVGPERHGTYFLTWRNIRSFFSFYKKVILSIGTPLHFERAGDDSTDQDRTAEINRTIMRSIGGLVDKHYPY